MFNVCVCVFVSIESDKVTIVCPHLLSALPELSWASLQCVSIYAVPIVPLTRTLCVYLHQQKEGKKRCHFLGQPGAWCPRTENRTGADK